MKNLLGDFNAKLEGEDIFKPRIGNDSLHQDSEDSGVRIVKFATGKKKERKKKEHNVPASKHSKIQLDLS